MRPSAQSFAGHTLFENAGIAERLVQWLRTRVFEICVLLWSLPFGVLIATYFQITRPPVQVRVALRTWSRGFIWLARLCIGVRYQVQGQEHVPDRPVIYACNHQSYWESIMLTAIIPDINVISKRAAMRIPVFGWGLEHAPMIPVDREQPGTNLRRIVRLSKESLAEGRSILIFPEGKRVPKGQTAPFERGVEMLYRATGAPIVPIVHNAGTVWPARWSSKRAGLITLRFLDPIEAGDDPKAAMHALRNCLNTAKETL